MSSNSDIKNINVALFYANWCGHCRNFYKKDSDGNPLSVEDAGVNTWQHIKSNLTEVGGTKVTCFEKEESECSEKDKELVEGWPTLIIKLNNNVYKYNGHRTLDDIKQSILRGIEQLKEGKELVGGNNIKYYNIDYKQKYKKYKKLYLQTIKNN